jgi:hypothetical protein
VPFQTDATLSTGAIAHRDLHNGMATLLNALENAGRGVISQVTRTTSFVPGGQADITGLTITHTPPGGRRYRARAKVPVACFFDASAGIVDIFLQYDGTTVCDDWRTVHPDYVSETSDIILEFTHVPTNASHTWKLVANSRNNSTTPGYVDATANRHAYLILEDIGI